MRTTVSVDDNLIAAAKRRARERGQTLGQVVEDALRCELAAPARREGLPLPVFHGDGGVRPGVDVTTNRGLREALDEGQALDELR